MNVDNWSAGIWKLRLAVLCAYNDEDDGRYRYCSIQDAEEVFGISLG